MQKFSLQVKQVLYDLQGMVECIVISFGGSNITKWNRLNDSMTPS